MSIIDFCLGLCIMSRMSYKRKICKIYDICDDDGDNCMRPAEILIMLQKLERMFCQETAQVNLKSTLLYYHAADKRAEHKFHFIMKMVKQVQEEERKLRGSMEEDEDDDLITSMDFLTALKRAPGAYESFLPRTLTFKEVLTQRPSEEVFKVSDDQLDNFVMFRYEMNTIFKKSQFVGEEDVRTRAFEVGYEPLSRIRGQQIKDVPLPDRKQMFDMYPGSSSLKARRS